MTRNDEPGPVAQAVVILSYPAGTLVFFGAYIVAGFLFLSLTVGDAEGTIGAGIGALLIGLPVALIATAICFAIIADYLERINYMSVIGALGIVIGPLVSVATVFICVAEFEKLIPSTSFGYILVIAISLVAPAVVGVAAVVGETLIRRLYGKRKLLP